MIKRVLITALPISVSLVTALFAFVPDSILQYINFFKFENEYVNLMLIRIFILVVAFVILFVGILLYRLFKRSVVIKGKEYVVEVAYKNIFDLHNCLKVINFDECLTTRVGLKPEDIKAGSVCGQYLTKFPLTDEEVTNLRDEYGLKPTSRKSNFNRQTCYESGRLLPKDDFLIMVFARLNKDGRGTMTRDEYIDCLNVLWREIDKYHGEKSVAIPVLGSNITYFEDSELSQQELLDIMISSYKINRRKIKKPQKLIICCRKKDNFSLNKIGEFI